MPIAYSIHADRRLVLAAGHGTVTADDFSSYQREVWTRPDVVGFDELVDMTDVSEIVEPSSERMRALAQLSAATDPPGSAARFAIVAPQDLAFGLGRMYEAYRGLADRSTKQVAVFRDRPAAVEWLGGVRGEPETPATGRQDARRPS